MKLKDDTLLEIDLGEYTKTWLYFKIQIPSTVILRAWYEIISLAKFVQCQVVLNERLLTNYSQYLNQRITK